MPWQTAIYKILYARYGDQYVVLAATDNIIPSTTLTTLVNIMMKKYHDNLLYITDFLCGKFVTMDGLELECRISIANELVIVQSCAKPSI